MDIFVVVLIWSIVYVYKEEKRKEKQKRWLKRVKQKTNPE
jgi:hypothetical protein